MKAQFTYCLMFEGRGGLTGSADLMQGWVEWRFESYFLHSCWFKAGTGPRQLRDLLHVQFHSFEALFFRVYETIIARKL